MTADTAVISDETSSIVSKPENPATSSSSWMNEFRNQHLRQESADLCADALSAMLLRNEDVLRASGSREAVFNRVNVALSSAFDHFSKPGCLASGSIESKPQDGEVVALAIVELIRTAKAAGHVVDRVMGSNLRSKLEAEFGESATMTKSEICWGLAFLVENLEEKVGGSMGIPSSSWTLAGPVRRMLARWINEFGLEHKLTDADTMLDILYMSELACSNRIANPVRSAALWLLQRDSNQVSACPDPILACTEHAKLASRLAEGVLLAFEAWNDRQFSQPPPERLENTESTGPMLWLPAKFGPLTDLQNNWMHWKVRHQAQGSRENSTFA